MEKNFETLEAGRTYLDRDGYAVYVTKRENISSEYPYPMMGDNGNSYTMSGFILDSDTSFAEDLVQLVENGLHLEEGEEYVTRAGEVVTVMSRPEEYHSYPFIGVENDVTYTCQGEVYSSSHPSEYDLVHRVVEVGLKLEEGKAYVTRAGDVVTVASRPPCYKQYPFKAVESGATYTAGGAVCINGVENEGDLIAEAPVSQQEIGVKFDNGKPDLTLLPQAGLLAAADVMTEAQSKYPVKDNWKHLDDGVYRTLAASLRHINQHLQGNHVDDESGKLHLAHAAVNILMALEHFQGEFSEDG